MKTNIFLLSILFTILLFSILLISCEKDTLNDSKIENEPAPSIYLNNDTLFLADFKNPININYPDSIIKNDGIPSKHKSSCPHGVGISPVKMCINNDGVLDYRIKFSETCCPSSLYFILVDPSGNQFYLPTNTHYVYVDFINYAYGTYTIHAYYSVYDYAAGYPISFHDCSSFTLPIQNEKYTSSGSSVDLDAYRSPSWYNLPLGYSVNDVIDIAADYDNNYNYVWYKNGKVSAGTTQELDYYRAPYDFSLPPGYTVDMIVGITMDGDNNETHVYYNNYKFSVGSTGDLDSKLSPRSYSLPPGYTPSDIVAMNRDGKENKTFVFFKNGMRSAGIPQDLDYYYSPGPYSLPCGYNISQIIGMAQDGDTDFHHVWYK